MDTNRFIVAVRERFFEAIVLASYFFWGPAKYIETYRLSWPETDRFLISFAIFSLFMLYLLRLIIRRGKATSLLKNIAFIATIRTAWSEGIEPILYRMGNLSKNYVMTFLISGFIIFGVMTLVQIAELYNKFVKLENPYFWDFLYNYFLYILAIFAIIAIVSLVIESIDNLMIR
jgi:hypothetical protein